MPNERNDNMINIAAKTIRQTLNKKVSFYFQENDMSYYFNSKLFLVKCSANTPAEFIGISEQRLIAKVQCSYSKFQSTG